jgi:NADH dehydrogenase FAD-containing subunit
MVPGWISGQFTLNEIRVDLLPLCRAANVRLIVDHIVGMDAERRCVARSGGEHLDYDLLSQDIGGETDPSWLQTLGDRLIAIRPFDLFIPRWQETIREAEGFRGFALLSNRVQLLADRVIAATGVRPACWLQVSRMSVEEEGYVLVDATHRSISHPEVFAAGDVCSRRDVEMERSGVHAVRAGSILAHNVIAAMTGKPMRVYRPRRRLLYLLACGPRYAVASWGPWSAEGAWVWYWKRWIDRRFVRSFRARSRTSEDPAWQATASPSTSHREDQE